MTWTKLPDDLPDRLIGLSDAAFRLHVATTVYANRIGLDGRIPKDRLSLVPAPPRSRRPAVARELEAAGVWADTGDAWQLVDFFDAQLSAEEITLQRHWATLRQRVRFAKTPELKTSTRREEDQVKAALWSARERRQARSTANLTSDSLVNHSAPIRPVPDPSRPDPKRGRGREREVGPTAPLKGAATDSNEGTDYLNRPSPWGPENCCARCSKPFMPPYNDKRVAVRSPVGVVAEVHENCVGELASQWGSGGTLAMAGETSAQRSGDDDDRLDPVTQAQFDDALGRGRVASA